VATCVSGTCGTANAPSGTACSDADACTKSDVCTAGVCAGTFDAALPGCGAAAGCAAAKVVGALPYVDAGTTAGKPNDFLVLPGECPDADNPFGFLGGKGNFSPDRVYAFTPSATGAYTFTLTAGVDKADLVLALYADACPAADAATALCLLGDDDIGSGGEFMATQLDGGSTYWLVVEGWSTTDPIEGTYELTVAAAPATETSCDDDKDNDGDGVADCDDTDCELAPICEPNDVPIGALALTEIMANPSSVGGAVNENNGEWLEVRNTTNSLVKLAGVWVAYRSWDDGAAVPEAPTAKFKLDTAATVAAGALAVLARSSAAADNGGITFAASYGQVVISNSKNVRIELIHPEWDGATVPTAGQIIDGVDIPSLTFTQVDGASWQLTQPVAAATNAAAQNDLLANWCFAIDAAAGQYIAGNFGTAGATNGICGSATAASYATDVQPIVGKKCAPCHTGITPGACSGAACHASIYSDTQKLSKATVVECAGKGYTVAECMEARILSGSMPLGQGCGGPVADNAANASKCITDSEFAVFQAWVAAGALP
jgi:hypothetical protein